MKDIELVIKIPEEQYRTLNAKSQNDVVAVIDNALLIKAIKNGTPITKGHGKIVDAKRVLENGDNWEVETALMQTEAIIEADIPEGEE